MKTLFIEARSKQGIDGLLEKVDFEGRMGLIATVQHLHLLPIVHKKLKGSVIGGQVLGCDVSNALKIGKRVDGYLFVGSGNFHPVQIAMKTGKMVIMLDPIAQSVSEVTPLDVEIRKKRITAGYAHFLNANRIGILVSSKPGQNMIKAAEQLKKKLNKEGKKAYIFAFDTLDFSQLENFPDIECWVNTACYRIAIEDYGKFPRSVVNISDIAERVECRQKGEPAGIHSLFAINLQQDVNFSLHMLT
ncbi:MAG: diphthamide synthesis protein [Nanoarchaeota archaeon]|nr:diphthamide synthesis protein [Nanoarchaeota archaeon]